jgi:hypothetical protein
VALSTLAKCPGYAGSNPFYLFPAVQPFGPASGSSWALSTVLTCGLSLPSGNVSAVTVYSPAHGFEPPLTGAQLTDARQFHDPQAPQALPVISQDGAENQNTYARPWFGGSDDNAVDQVIETGAPVVIVVYETGARLDVSATSRVLAHRAGAVVEQFDATVRDPSGATIPASALAWHWNFDDDFGSGSPAPAHSFVPGTYAVTVEVTDTATGSGGTATIDVTSQGPAASGTTPRSGAGNSPTANAPTGPSQSDGTQPGGRAGKPGAGPGRSGGSQSTTAAASRAPTTADQATTPSVAGGTAHSPAARTGARRSAPSHTRAPATSAPVRLVSGRLIGDVRLLPAQASPLVQVLPGSPATAPPVRRAIRASLLPGLAAGLAVTLLFSLGAGRELRGRPRRRALG